MAKWFLINISVPVEGVPQTESYLVDAVSFTEAEARITKEMEEIHSEMEILTITPLKLSDVFDNTLLDVWYKCKMG